MTLNKGRPLGRQACLALMIATGCTQLPQRNASPAAASAAGQEIVLTTYLGDLRTIPLRINGWSGRALFDTGGGLVLLTPAAADSVGCRPVGRLTGFRYTGERFDAPRCGTRSLASGSYSHATELAVFDLMALLGNAPVLSGIVGLPLFEGHVLTIDLPGNRLVIDEPNALQGARGTALPLQVRVSRQASGSALDLLVAVRTPEGPIWLELDSGNIGPVLLAPHAARMLGLALSIETAAPVMLDIVGIGPVTLNAVERDGIYDGLLNSELFRKFVITLDLRGMRASASPVTR
jgi:hypothetical protein